MEKAQKYMRKRSRVEDRPYKLPFRCYRSRVELNDFEGHQVIRFYPKQKASKTVLYLHGGAYVQEVSFFHIRYCDILCSAANINIITPLYKLAPNHTWEEAYSFLTSLYSDVHPDVIMGDSAGGGLAAGFVQYLSSQNVSLPEKVCLLSPWVDVSMKSDYSDYVKKDPMLGVDGLREMGRVWAGDLDVSDYKISPLYGAFDGFPETLIFTGTREIFYPDVLKFHQKLVQTGLKTVLVTGTGMNHVYPMYPIPEARKALETVIRFLTA